MRTQQRTHAAMSAQQCMAGTEAPTTEDHVAAFGDSVRRLVATINSSETAAANAPAAAPAAAPAPAPTHTPPAGAPAAAAAVAAASECIKNVPKGKGERGRAAKRFAEIFCKDFVIS